MSNEKSDRELLIEISDSLKKILGVLAIDGKDQDDQIKILHSLGQGGKTIGELLGMPYTTVRKHKSRLKLKSQ